MKITLAFLILIFFVGSIPAQAAKYRRLVNFEWEAIEGAKTYEVELTPVNKTAEDEKEKVFKFTTQSASWNGRLKPGDYILKLRSRDYRGVPGEWSPSSDFHVGLDNVVLKAPSPNSMIKTNELDKALTHFQWSPVEGADLYEFMVASEDGTISVTETLKTTDFKIPLPVAKIYQWKVQAKNTEGIASESSDFSRITIQGKALEKTKITMPESEFVRDIHWSRPAFSENFDVMILRYNPKTKKFEKFQVISKTTDTTLPFSSNWPGGRYKVGIRANADLRPSSELAQQVLVVRSGDRSPAAEYTALVRKSIDRVTGWYGIASYLVTEIDFKGANTEKNSVVHYNALGATARLGLGWFNPRSAWGFLGIVDISGFTFKGNTQTYAAAEINSIYRIQLQDRAELRLQAGAYFKELPETVGDPLNGQAEDLKISSLGPHLGAELWYSLSPKMGVQVNVHAYSSLAKVHTPNGNDLKPTLSTQFGILGSYRFTPQFTGLIGYALREDKVAYRAQTDPSSFATEGDLNESTIVGNYLNIFAEWAF